MGDECAKSHVSCNSFCLFIRGGPQCATRLVSPTRYHLPFPFADPRIPRLTEFKFHRVSHNLHRRGCNPLTRRVPRQITPIPPLEVFPMSLSMLGVNFVNVDDPRAYYNKPRDHARQNHVEILGRDEPGSASFPILLLLSIWCRGLTIHILNHHSPVRPSSSSDSPAPVDTCVPVYRRLIPDEAVSRIEAIVTNKGDTRLTDCLPGDAAQTFIDSIQEVHLHCSSFPKPGLIVFTPLGSFAFDRLNVRLPSIRLWISPAPRHGSGGSV